MSSLSHSTPGIFALPTELVEEALVIAAARGFPSAIAAFGSSCQRFHHLVSSTTDNHLWREIFLTTFDDPRLVLKLLKATTTIGPGEGSKDIMFDWAGEFQRRMKTRKLFRKFNEATPKLLDLFSNSDEDTSVDDSLTLATALETVISVLETAAPLQLQRSDPMPSGHTFPPIMTLHISSTYPPEFISRNSRWVDEILQCGYPPILEKRYLHARHQPSKPLKVTEDAWNTYSEERQLFHKLVFQKGFAPVPNSRASDVPWKILQSLEDQNVSARQVARSQVYNFRYLRPERSWGPFLPANGSLCDAGDKSQSNSSFPNFEQELFRYTLNSVGQELSDSEDLDFVPDENDQDGDEDNDEDVLGFSFARRRVDPKFVMPSPHEVKPDYTYLAAARILVEMNIREILTVNDPFDAAVLADWPGPVDTVNDAVIVDALASLDLNRMGGAPTFWEKGWVATDAGEGRDSPAVKPMVPKSSRKGKGKATEVEWIQGWDWAGVAGRWVRVVCWFDYRDLLLHNLHGYHGDNMSETINFFPTDLRIVGYSKPPEPDLSQLEVQDLDAPVWKLPVIHIEGISHGPHDEPGTHSNRTIRGTVRMLKDGAIRWTLMSYHFHKDTPEWSTEGIQIGSIGSAVGMLGMWTGANHDSTDPLGPIWTWKVA